jgi:hypothetical protein
MYCDNVATKQLSTCNILRCTWQLHPTCRMSYNVGDDRSKTCVAPVRILASFLPFIYSVCACYVRTALGER